MKVWDHLDRWFAPVCGIALIMFGSTWGAIAWSHGNEVAAGFAGIGALCGVVVVTWELSRLYHAIDTVWGTLDDVLKSEDQTSPED